MDHLELNYGGNTAKWGSGAIGGVVNINNEKSLHNGLQIHAHSQMGSFGRWTQQAQIDIGNKRLTTSTKYFHQQAKNNFPIRTATGSRRQSHAHIRQDGLLNELYWNPRPMHKLSLHTWLQRTHKEIPPTTVQNRSEAKQSDQTLRTVLNWNNTRNQSIVLGRLGYTVESIDFIDPLAGVDSKSQFQTIFGEGEWQLYPTKRTTLQAGITTTWMWAQSDGYYSTESQSRVATFLSFQHQIHTWILQLTARQERVDGNFVPLVTHLGVSGNIHTNLLLSAKISKNYRLPTLNNLYWTPGGNPDLKPEEGWSQEMTIKISDPPGHFPLSYSITAFNRNIRNWILWALQDGQSFWSAFNLARVWSRGLEQRITFQQNISTIQTHISGGYDLVWSTNEKAIELPKIEAGEQLIYVPRHQAFGKFELKYNRWTTTYFHTYTGKVNSINLDPLSDYHLATFSIQYYIPHLHGSCQVSLRIDNVWNTQYRVIEYRAMPGRNFLFGVSLSTNPVKLGKGRIR